MEEVDEIILSGTRYRNSRKTYFPFYFMAAILLALLIYFKQGGLPLQENIVLGIVAFVGLVIVISEFHRIGNSYHVAPFFVVHRKGYFSKEIKKVAIASISDIDIKQSFWQRLLRYGCVEVHLFSSNSIVIIRNINNPESFVTLIESEINRVGKEGKNGRDD